MGEIDRHRLELIRRVLIKWTTGQHRAKRYTLEQKRLDLKRLEEINIILETQKV